ncbi:MAG TPA: hypothetical protein VMR54_09400 [Thermoanaerobaculia bacterium]|nr:hypothetical protein [Thermoanaerobaculia bacterium]
MEPRTLFKALRIALGSLLVAGIAPALLADDGPYGRCSNWSVAGPYGYTTTGTRIGVGPVAGVGLVTLGRDGSISGSQTVSFNGTIADETITGTYTVNADCAGQVTVNVVSSIPTFNRTSTLDFVWVNHSDAVHAIFTSAGTIITLDGQKVNP